MSETYLDNLNEVQIEAVQATEGRIRVNAGAGSGKTKALTHRYVYLVKHLGISPAHILCLTFTNKAASEMRQRINKMIDAHNVNDFICTIHGFCVKILRRDIYRLGFTSRFTILDEEDLKSIAKQIMDSLHIDRKDTNVKKILSDIEKKKRGYDYITKYMLPNSRKSVDSEPIDDVFRAYIQLQLKTFALDFNDLINFALYILTQFQEVREFWQQELEYIMLDEAQDCNPQEWELIEVLAAVHNNLFIVGDANQAIYAWRGASPSGFLNFKNDQTIQLNQNYRSTPNILNVANSVIKNNEDRIKMDLFTNNAIGKAVVHFHGKNEEKEMEWVAKQIVKAHKEGVNYSDFAILYRASYMTRILEQYLIKYNLPYKIYGGIRFYERKEIKDALSYLRLVNQGDNLSFNRIINEPSRKIGKVFLEKVKDYATEHSLLEYDALKEMIDEGIIEKESACQFVEIIQAAKQKQYRMSISDLLEYILQESGYIEMIRLDGDEERQINLENLKLSIKNYESANANEDISLDTFLQDIALYTNADMDTNVDAIKLMTIHQSKGLEFPFVFIICLFDGGLPSFRTIREFRREGMEEERRLMYVAITRAENALFLTESEGYDFNSQGEKYPSRFLREISENLIITEGIVDKSLWKRTDNSIHEFNTHVASQKKINRLKKGESVYHENFGEGEVLSICKDGSVQVKFENGVRTILAEYLCLQKIKQQNPKTSFIFNRKEYEVGEKYLNAFEWGKSLRLISQKAYWNYKNKTLLPLEEVIPVNTKDREKILLIFLDILKKALGFNVKDNCIILPKKVDKDKNGNIVHIPSGSFNECMTRLRTFIKKHHRFPLMTGDYAEVSLRKWYREVEHGLIKVSNEQFKEFQNLSLEFPELVKRGTKNSHL